MSLLRSTSLLLAGSRMPISYIRMIAALLQRYSKGQGYTSFLKACPNSTKERSTQLLHDNSKPHMKTPSGTARLLRKSSISRGRYAHKWGASCSSSVAWEGANTAIFCVSSPSWKPWPKLLKGNIKKMESKFKHWDKRYSQVVKYGSLLHRNTCITINTS